VLADFGYQGRHSGWVVRGETGIVGHGELPSPAEDFQIMVMPAINPLVTTIEELLALPADGMRHELLDGEHVVTPAPAYGHQSVLARLYDALRPALEGRPNLELLWSPADIVLGPRTLVQPDLFVLRVDPGMPPASWAEAGVPVLAIEVLSPGTASRDRGKKRRIYQAAGVAEYWVVDPGERLIERWRPDNTQPEILTERLDWAWEGTPLATVDVRDLLG
jgi:Uma2 family endonuclease